MGLQVFLISMKYPFVLMQHLVCHKHYTTAQTPCHFIILSKATALEQIMRFVFHTTETVCSSLLKTNHSWGPVKIRREASL